METQHFLIYNKQLGRSTTLINKMTGEVLTLTFSDKVLYSWCYERYKFWRSIDKTFHDNQDFIAKENGTSSRTVIKFIKKFSDFGIIIKGLGNSTGGKRNSNNYIVVDIYESSVYTLS